MLKTKEISSKKTRIYLVIIGLTVGICAFLLYRSLSTAKNIASPELLPGVANLTRQAEIEKLLNLQKSQRATTSQPSLKPFASQAESLIDLSLFESKKFKALKENIIPSKKEIEIGKRNPFKPTATP